MSLRVWTLGLGASAVLHGAGLAAIGLTTQPEDLPDQPVPRSAFSIEAAEVPRSKATPEAATGDTAAAQEAKGTTAASSTIAQTRAEATAIPSAPLEAAALPKPTAASRPDAQVARPADLASASVITAKSAPAVRLTTSLAPTQTAPVTPQALRAQTATIATLSSTPTAALAPEGPNATAVSPTISDIAPAPLPATAGKATLAWSGDDSAPVPAASLAAIAAFTQEGDLSAASAQVRDGIEGILASVPCARLQTTFLPETGQLELRGHIPEDGLKGPVLAALRAQVGDAIPLSDALLILPRPQCGALAGIADIGLPQSNEQLDNPKVIGADGFARNTTYFDGDAFYLEMTGADYDAYLYVDYFDKDGNVIHLQPNAFVPNRLVAADEQVLVGKSDGTNPALDLKIGPPFGQEIAAAFASSVPLYKGDRPLIEPAAPYLAFLKDRVAAARAEHADFKGEWVYFFITTRPR